MNSIHARRGFSAPFSSDSPGLKNGQCTLCGGEGWLPPSDMHSDGSYSTSRECPRCRAGYQKSEQPATDTQCLQLAKHFLTDEPGATHEDLHDLSDAIQSAVENWFFLREHEAVVAAEGDESSSDTGAKR